jgi:hypothetical protein
MMNLSDIIIYQNPDDNIKIDVRLEEETVWLTQTQMTLLFSKARITIKGHIQNVFKKGELDEKIRSFWKQSPIPPFESLRVTH